MAEGDIPQIHGNTPPEQRGTHVPLKKEFPKGVKPETREAKQALGEALWRVFQDTADFVDDVGKAAERARFMLRGQSVTGKILEGAVITGTGALTEKLVETAGGEILGDLIGVLRKTPDAVWNRQTTHDIPYATGAGDAIDLAKEQQYVRERVTLQKNEPLDKDMRPIDTSSVDVRKYLRDMIDDKFGDSPAGKMLSRALKEGVDDVAVMGIYNFVNRTIGNPLPQVTGEYLGYSLLSDLGSAAVGDAEGTLANLEQKQSLSHGEKAKKWFLKVTGLSNPVTIFGLSEMKQGFDYLNLAYQTVREERKHPFRKPSGNVTYVGESRPGKGGK